MNVHLAQSIQARNELRRIANVKYQIIGVKDSNPIIGCQQDALSGAFLLTQSDVRIKGSDVANILCNTSSTTKDQIDMNKEYTGQEVFSHIIPKGINNIKKNDKGEITFQIKDGELLTGLLDKSSLSTAKNSIIHFIWDKYGPNKTREFIDDAQKLILNFLLLRGMTISFRDAFLAKDFEEKIKKLLDNTVLENKYILTQYENDIDQISPAIIEADLNARMSVVGNDVGGTIKKNLNISNLFWAIVSSGAKGTETNLQQMTACIGQQSIEGRRIMKKVEGRSMIYFHKDDDTPEARGFTRSSLLDGLKGYEAFIFTTAGREGLIDTAIKSVTWETPIVIVENGEPKYTEIGKWIDNKLDNNKEQVKHYKDRDMELLDTRNILIPTTDENGIVSWGEVSAVTRHDPGDQLYEIKTNGGRKVIVTESKSLLIWDKENKKLKEMLTPDIKIGDCVPVTEKLCCPPILCENITDNELIDKKDYISSSLFIASEEVIIKFLDNFISNNGIITEKNIIINDKSKRKLEGINMLYSRIGIFGTINDNDNYSTLKISGKWIKIFLNKIQLSNESKNESLKNINITESDTIFDTYNNVVLDEIVEINLVDVALHPKVYDLTIPTTLNFGLANGLQVRDTAQTGYLQRKLIKGLEDISIKYDGTNRNSRGVVIQYVYGENGINQACQTEIKLTTIEMDNKKLEEVFGFTPEQMKKLEKKHKISNKQLNDFNTKYLNKLKKYRNEMRVIQMRALMNFKTMEEKFMLPVNLFRLTQDYSNKTENLELTPDDVLDSINEFLDSPEIRLLQIANKGNDRLKQDDKSLKFILEVALHEYLSPNKCIFNYGMTKKDLANIWTEIKNSFVKAIAEPGEMVGILAAQSIGEPTTQLNLNTKHFAGVASKSGAVSGVPRILELLSLTKDIKTPQIMIYFNNDIRSDRNAVNRIASYFKFLSIKNLIDSAFIYYDVNTEKLLKNDNVSTPFFVNNQKAELSSLPFVFRIKLNLEKMLDKETTLLDIKTKFISYWYKNFTNIKTMKKNDKDIFNKISRCAILSNSTADKEQIIHIRFSMSSFNYQILVDFLNIVLNDITLKGIDGIKDINMEEQRVINFDENSGEVKVEKEFVVTTTGINLEKLKYMKGINNTRIRVNDIYTVYRNYGIEATRQILIKEYMDVLGDKLNNTHLSVLVDMMTHNGDITSIDRHGLSKLDSDPCAKASFEQTMDHFMNAAIFNERDTMKSISSNVMLGKVIPGGTGSFDLMLDTNKLENSEYTSDESGGRITFAPLEEDAILKDILKYGINQANFFMPSS